jgi:LmbE family N-acetylglucosaminyl deacetylase
MLTSYAEEQPRRDLVAAIRSIKPDVVMTWYPYPNFNMPPSEGKQLF